MVEKSTQWSQRLNGNYLGKNNSKLAMSMTVQRTLEYPLRALTLGRAECEKIQRPIVLAVLPRMGLARTFPRNVVFAPKASLGLGFRALFDTQGIEHIVCVTQHVQSQSSTGHLIRSNLEAVVLESGSNRIPL